MAQLHWMDAEGGACYHLPSAVVKHGMGTQCEWSDEEDIYPVCVFAVLSSSSSLLVTN